MWTNPTVVFGYWPLRPLIMAKTISKVLVGCGASRGPITKDGLTTTRSIPFSLANFHASCSPKVFAYAYQSCELEKSTKDQVNDLENEVHIHFLLLSYVMSLTILSVAPMRLIENADLLNIFPISYS